MSDSTSLLRTPLADIHRALGGKMVPFAGWEMPVQYPAGIMAEHQAVRNGCGVFDVSHMGEFEVTGPDRNAFVNRITSNDVGALAAGQVQYSAILNKEGTFVDDCTVYRFDNKLMIVVNASNRAKAWVVGPCTARSPMSSEMSRSRMLAPPFRSTTCSHALARLEALTTIISLSSNRYTVQSSTKVPSLLRMAEY